MKKLYEKAYKVLFFTDLIASIPSSSFHIWLINTVDFDWFYHLQSIVVPSVFLFVVFLVRKYGNIHSFYGKYCFFFLVLLAPLHFLCFLIECSTLVAFLETGDLLCFKASHTSVFEVFFNFYMES